jgi:threonine dehydrogenase-like Zn-dependent dehydrogenase
MKVLVWHGPRNMTVEQREVPKPGPGEALVQVKAVGICGSEVEGYLGQNSLRFPPLIMGHEFSGEIVESGSMIGESPTVARSMDMCAHLPVPASPATASGSLRRYTAEA